MQGTMRIIRDDFIFDVDIQKTVDYYRTHSVCECPACKSLYSQAKKKFPALSSFLKVFGVDISRPDETGWSDEGEETDYHFVAYTVVGKIVEMGEYEIDLNDGGLFLNIVIDNSYTTSEQTDESFTITVYGIRLSKRFQAI